MPKLILSTHPPNSADSDRLCNRGVPHSQETLRWVKWELTVAHRNSLLLQDSISRTWRGVTTCRREQRYFPWLVNVSMNEQLAKDALLVNQKTKVILVLSSHISGFHGYHLRPWSRTNVLAISKCVWTPHITHLWENHGPGSTTIKSGAKLSQGCAETSKWWPFTIGI